MTPLLYRFRGELIGLWCLGATFACWSGRGGRASMLPLVAGLGLRIWARRYAGSHTRGRRMAAPYRAVGGPYRYFAHPLYVANVLVLAGLAWRLAGERPIAVAIALSGPVVLYVVLARAESRLLRQTDAQERLLPVDAAGGRWKSEWASILPPLVAWVAAGWR